MTVHHRAVKFCVLGENIDSCWVTSNHHGEHPRQSHTDRGSATRVLACQQRWRVCSAAKESVLPRLLRAGLAPVCVGSRKGLAAGVGWSDPRNHVITSKVRASLSARHSAGASVHRRSYWRCSVPTVCFFAFCGFSMLPAPRGQYQVYKDDAPSKRAIAKRQAYVSLPS